MNEKQLQVIITIVGLVFQYGVPAVTSAIAALSKENITLEDIEALKITKEPEEY